ncbi:LuxR family transcriptional regulator [Scytonema hofmannii PCC 7110]|uniref:LuxR family transcriptional regulator n=1 Tax=Scytonema hofmannii PCC 7110 TaxID=128403 RepID=A0A139XFM9_9CYAN|nr:response regulator transcription factor [Scytonema hofmannii]KYC43500.1 LuxR family transcriptional regulator [Scytonema hofmannii PCC 7110]
MTKSLVQSNLIRVLIADDHPVVRQGLAAMIEREPDMVVVAQAGDGHSAIEMFCEYQPDVTLMDLRMPKMGGVDAIDAICNKFNDARIIVLTTFDGDEDIYRGLRAGARGYLLKDAEPDELLRAIRTVASNQKYLQPTVGAKLAERMSNPELSDRETQVLRLMAVGKSNQDISAALRISESTVKFHINNILSKLSVNDRTQAVLVALKRGIVNLS